MRDFVCIDAWRKGVDGKDAPGGERRKFHPRPFVCRCGHEYDFVFDGNLSLMLIQTTHMVNLHSSLLMGAIHNECKDKHPTDQFRSNGLRVWTVS
jgi:hypothetical protein